MPMVLYFTAVLMESIFRKPAIKLSLFQVVFAVFYFGIVFEWLLPLYSGKYTGDPVDLVMYGFGGVAFFILQAFRTSGLKPNQSTNHGN
jgi:hypothetical protein